MVVPKFFFDKGPEAFDSIDHLLAISVFIDSVINDLMVSKR